MLAALRRSAWGREGSDTVFDVTSAVLLPVTAAQSLDA